MLRQFSTIALLPFLFAGCMAGAQGTHHLSGGTSRVNFQAPKRPHYQSSTVRMAPVEKSHRPGLEAIARRLAESKTLYRRNQEGRIKRVSPSAVTSIPLAALKAIAVVHQSELRGGEIDMRIPIAGRSSTVPVSVIMEMSGRVLFEIAKTPRTQVHRNSWTPRYKAGNKN